MSFKTDMSASSDAFMSIVWPSIAHLCGGGDMMPVESTIERGFARDLDMLAGIDAFQVRKGKSMVRGLASRVQFGPKAWDSFTIRYKRKNGARTEYSKRTEALTKIDLGYLCPHLTIQAYINNGRLLSAAICTTRRLFAHADLIVSAYESGEKPPFGGVRPKNMDVHNAQFIWIPWGALSGHGFLQWTPPAINPNAASHPSATHTLHPAA